MFGNSHQNYYPSLATYIVKKNILMICKKKHSNY